jgi:hypothetical protein
MTRLIDDEQGFLPRSAPQPIADCCAIAISVVARRTGELKNQQLGQFD